MRQKVVQTTKMMMMTMMKTKVILTHQRLNRRRQRRKNMVKVKMRLLTSSQNLRKEIGKRIITKTCPCNIQRSLEL